MAAAACGRSGTAESHHTTRRPRRAQVRRSGLRGSHPDESGSAPDDAEIERLVALRADAKRARRYDEADRIRAGLAAVGIVLEDSAGGTTWRR